MLDKNGCEWVHLYGGPLINDKELLATYGVVKSLSFDGALVSCVDPSGVFDLVDYLSGVLKAKQTFRPFEDVDRPPGEPCVASRYFVIVCQGVEGHSSGVMQYRDWNLYQLQCPSDGPAPDPDGPPAPGPVGPWLNHKTCPDGAVVEWMSDQPEPPCPKKIGTRLIWQLLPILGIGALAAALVYGLTSKKRR